MAVEKTNYEPLYTDMCVFGTTQDLAKIKSRYKNNFQSLAMDWRKNEIEGWATEEWRWEIESQQAFTFQISDDSTKREDTTNKEEEDPTNKEDPTHKDSQYYLSRELSKRVIWRLKNKYIPSTHRLFYWWLKDIEDSEEGQEFVLAIKCLCFNESKKITQTRTIQRLRTFFHIHNPPYE